MSEQIPITPDDGSKAVPPKNSSSSNKTLIIVLAVIAVIVVLPMLVFAGGALWLSRGDNVTKLTENAIEKASGDKVKIDRDGESVSIKTEDGSFSASAEQKLPKDFPSEVPTLDGQTVEVSSSSSSDGNYSWYVTAKTTKSTQEVKEFFENKLADWEKGTNSTYNDAVFLSFTKDILSVNLSISPNSDDNNTSIIYTVSRDNN